MEDYQKMDMRLGGALTSLNPFKQNNSASRAMMDASHLAQTVVLENPDPIPISTGMDYNYADYLFDIRLNGAEGDMCRIIKILKKYKKFNTADSIDHNPEYYVIYENLRTNEVDVAIVPSYYYHHTTFGFNYVFTSAFNNMREKELYPAGTVLATSPSYNNDTGTWCFGLNTKVLCGSFPEVIEDGVAISESYAKRASSRTYGRLAINYGHEYYLLNLYGDENNYKPFPDIGERIRPDGLLFALRKLDPMLAPVQMTPRALMAIDYSFDQLHYAEANAVIEDITVHHSHDTSTYYTPTGMSCSSEKYFNAREKFCQDLEGVYYHLKSTKKDGLNLSPALHHLIVDNMRLSHKRLKRTNRVTYRKEDLSQYRVEVVYSSRRELMPGSKVSDLSGGKGIVVKVIPDHLMPGGVDMLVDDGSTIHRMNTGRVWEHESNALINRLRDELHEKLTQNNTEEVFNELLDFYRVFSPYYHDIIQNGIRNLQDKRDHINHFIDGRITIVMPIGSVETGSKHSLELSHKYEPIYDYVDIFDHEGKPHRSKNKMLISNIYIIVLEKIGEYWAATTVPKRQHHGIISKLSSITKNALPYRNQSTRLMGETEVRTYMAACNPAFAVSQLYMANSNEMTTDAVRTILKAEDIANIPELIDYTKLKNYKSISVERINHFLNCFGVEYYYDDEREHTFEEATDLGIDVTEYNYGDGDDD